MALDRDLARVDWFVGRMAQLERDHGFASDPRAVELKRAVASWLVASTDPVPGIDTGDPARDALILDIAKTRWQNQQLESQLLKIAPPDLC